jgi:hypothetical protein
MITGADVLLIPVDPTAQVITCLTPLNIQPSVALRPTSALPIAPQLNVLQNIGTLLTFIQSGVYGTISLPETGNITVDPTNANLGVVDIIIHNSVTPPTLSAAFKKLSTSGNYVTGVINYIQCTYINSTEIVYSINQRT